MHSAVAGRCSCPDPACPSPGKHPRIAWEALTQIRASAGEVDGWWRRWPHANVGVVTGSVSELVVLDVDPRHGGVDALAALESEYGALPRTVESLTGGGGQHLYFRHPGTRVPSRPVASGLDLKGDGGIVVSPPSIHVTGRAYVWESGSAPSDVAIADMPAWLLRAAFDPPEAGVAAHRTAQELAPRTATERRDFAALWDEVGVTLSPGDNYYRCPFHDDRHPSLHIDAEGCRFYCFGCARGGGIGRLRRLAGTFRGAAPLETARPGFLHAPDISSAVTGELTLTGTTDVDVVGVSQYQDALLQLTGGRRSYAGVRMVVLARLVPEPENAADPDAVAVTIAGCTVGYLRRADASRLHAVIDAAIRARGEASCAATIVGGWEREHGDIGYFGVRLQV